MLYEEVVKETSVVKSGFSLISSCTFSLDFFEDFQDAFFWENLWRAACTVDDTHFGIEKPSQVTWWKSF